MRRPKRPRPRTKPKTDLGTIILHWLLVGALLGAITTGLRLASQAPDHDWIAALDGAWIGHLWSALVLIVVAITYPIYMWRAALVPRIRLDAVRLRGLAHPRYRWATINVVLNWACYLSVPTAILTGGLLYFDLGGAVVTEIHWLATWTIIAMATAHVLAHFAFGGVAQLRRLFRPARLPPTQPHFDPHLDLDEPSNRSDVARSVYSPSGHRLLRRNRIRLL